MRQLARLGSAFTVGIALAMTPALRAQAPGHVDIGAFGRYTLLDRDISQDNAIGFGGRFGIFLLKNFALELETFQSATSGNSDVNLKPYYVRLAYHRPLSTRFTGIVSGGWVHDRTNPDGPGGIYGDDGISLSAGLQIGRAHV